MAVMDKYSTEPVQKTVQGGAAEARRPSSFCISFEAEKQKSCWLESC